jgi:UDP-glucose 4-epimerase
MRILITGGFGFIGRHLINKFPNDDVIVFDNLYNSKVLKGYKFIYGDIRNYDDLLKIGKVDIIYHLAAHSSVFGCFQSPLYTYDTNIKGTYNLLKYANSIKCKKFVFISSREVYGNTSNVPVYVNHQLNPLNLYGFTKMIGEKLCESLFPDCSIIRLTNVYGFDDKNRVIPEFINNAINDKPLVVYGGKQVLDFIYIDDAIKGIIIISQFNGIYNLGTGKGINIHNLAKKIIKLTKSKSRIILRKSRNFDVSNYVTGNTFFFPCITLDDGIKRISKGLIDDK